MNSWSARALTSANEAMAPAVAVAAIGRAGRNDPTNPAPIAKARTTEVPTAGNSPPMLGNVQPVGQASCDVVVPLVRVKITLL